MIFLTLSSKESALRLPRKPFSSSFLAIFLEKSSLSFICKFSPRYNSIKLYSEIKLYLFLLWKYGRDVEIITICLFAGNLFNKFLIAL